MTTEIGQLRKQLVHLLGIYPILSTTMIQSFLGAKVRPRVWKPVLETMVKDGTLVRYEVISENCFGQLRSYTCIRLADNAP
jgi:hypothetical protein